MMGLSLHTYGCNTIAGILMTIDSDGDSTNCTCKVGRLLTRYEFEDLNDELVARWVGNRGEQASVRTLADQLNQRLLRVEMRNAGMELVEGQEENLYDLLTDDDQLEAVRMQARSSLEGHGIDVPAVEDRFISHQTLYRHLTNCLNASKETNRLSLQKERDRITSLQNRVENVLGDSVSRLRDGGELDLDTFEVLVNFRIACESCGTFHDATALLDDGGCNCQR